MKSFFCNLFFNVLLICIKNLFVFIIKQRLSRILWKLAESHFCNFSIKDAHANKIVSLTFDDREFRTGYFEFPDLTVRWFTVYWRIHCTWQLKNMLCVCVWERKTDRQSKRVGEIQQPCLVPVFILTSAVNFLLICNAIWVPVYKLLIPLMKCFGYSIFSQYSREGF